MPLLLKFPVTTVKKLTEEPRLYALKGITYCLIICIQSPWLPVFANSPATNRVRADKNKLAFATRASWYGGRFNGRRTASGERFDQNSLTAASPNLPFGTTVTVKNPLNGRTCNVVINDRGPHVRGRGLDLSRAAAQKLGIDGVSPVVCYADRTAAGARHPHAGSATRIASIRPQQIDLPPDAAEKLGIKGRSPLISYSDQTAPGGFRTVRAERTKSGSYRFSFMRVLKGTARAIKGTVRGTAHCVARLFHGVKTKVAAALR